MDKDLQEKFTYSPWSLSWEEYWKIAKEKMGKGQYLPFYYYRYASDFASKLYSVLTEEEKWEKCYKNRYIRLGFVYHKWSYNNPPNWWTKENQNSRK